MFIFQLGCFFCLVLLMSLRVLDIFLDSSYLFGYMVSDTYPQSTVPLFKLLTGYFAEQILRDCMYFFLWILVFSRLRTLYCSPTC